MYTSLVVIGTTVNHFYCYILPTTLYCLNLFVVVYKPLHIVVFIKLVKYIYKLSFTKLLYFFSYMDTCIAIIMYCQMQFLLFTGKNCLHNFFGYLPATIISIHANFQVRWCYSFGSTALQQDLVEENEEEHEKNMFLCISHMLCPKT